MSGTGLNDLPEMSRRLTALGELAILDTAPEQGFDDVVLLATRICEAPVALVSLVAADRQWFKAQVGFPLSQTPLNQSVCAHALERAETLVIPDLTQDDRTRDNALVTGEPLARFYAGIPLRTGGVAVGTLCVIDTVARPGGLTSVQLSSLEALARQVETQFELRRLLAEQARAAAAKLVAEEAARRHQELVGLELGHRLKNILAMVQAITSQTLRHATSLGEARDSLQRRIRSLGSAHDILFQGPVEAAGVLPIIRNAVTLHDNGIHGRCHLSGPDVDVGPRGALMFALMMHELATNAVKYGSLSSDTGIVTITWSLEEEDEETTFVLLWRESGGPPVLPPSRQGFGTRLIQGALTGAVGGKVTLEFPPQGVTCRFEAPLSGFSEDEPEVS